MKKLLLSIIACVFTATIFAQVTTNPAIIQQGYKGEITIIFNPNEGNKGMVGATQCYAHTGYNNWLGAPTWRSGLDKHKMTKNAQGNWELKITPNMYSYYGVSESTAITRLCFVFNDGKNGSKEGKDANGQDIFVPVVASGLAVSLSSNMPDVAEMNTSYTIYGNATETATLVLKQGNNVLKTQTGTQLSYTVSLKESGDVTFTLEATAGGTTKSASLTAFVAAAVQQQTRPAGIEQGIYGNSQSVTLCTYAAHCKTPGDRSNIIPESHVFLVGDFNNWSLSNNYQLKRDGNYFWISLTNLDPTKDHFFQYAVVRTDGVVKYISDLFSEKLLHPDDQYEPRKIDPTLPAYPSKADGGYVSVILKEKNNYQWSDATLSFKRPNKNNLIIYEMWVYDYTPARSFKGVMERLDYLQNLGVNCIEFMPVSEFDGNYNWGYSPNHYMALDKAYGTPTEFKQLIDACHKRGMAVVLDMVFNHATGNNPMNKLYPYGNDLQYNPWFNVTPPHINEDGGNTYYEDWNHDFAPTKAMVKRALRYWLEEYKIDGYRLDLSHGFCGTNLNTRYSNLKEYRDVVNATSPGAYFIQEYWGGSPSKSTIINDGMLCWTGKGLSDCYAQLAMGYVSNSSLAEANNDGYIAYNESHDEERNFYKAKTWGAGAISTNEETRLSRIAAVMGFNTLLNGSHMMYQYGEIGYDWSIDENGRTGTKPRFEGRGWLNKGNVRMQQLQRVSKIIQLRTRLMPSVFEGNPTDQSIYSTLVRSVQWGNNVYVVANFEPSTSKTVNLPSGTWYDYLDGGNKATSSYSLKPGEIKVFTGSQVQAPEIPDHYNFSVDVENVFEDNTSSTTEAIKYYYEGQIYILRNGITYDLFGHCVK